MADQADAPGLPYQQQQQQQRRRGWMGYIAQLQMRTGLIDPNILRSEAAGRPPPLPPPPPRDERHQQLNSRQSNRSVSTQQSVPHLRSSLDSDGGGLGEPYHDISLAD